MEGKIKQIIHRMVEKRHPETKRNTMRLALMSVLSNQIDKGRLQEDDKEEMLSFLDMILDEYYVEN